MKSFFNLSKKQKREETSADFTKDRDIAIKNEFLISTEREETKLKKPDTDNNGSTNTTTNNKKESFGFG